MLAIFTILSIYMTVSLISEVVDSLNGTGIEKEAIKLWCIMIKKEYSSEMARLDYIKNRIKEIENKLR